MDDASREVGGAADPVEIALVEVDAAISLVAHGAAVRVSLCGLAAAERVAITGASRAQAAGVAFRLRHDDVSAATLVIGPRTAPRILRSK